jgi:hypothetical protein
MTGPYYRAEDFPDVQRPPDNFAYVIPVDNEPEHTADSPFCWDSGCECHEDADAIGLVAQYVERGLLTPQEATDFVGGKGI